MENATSASEVGALEMTRKYIDAIGGQMVLHYRISPEQAVGLLNRWSYGGQRKIREARIRTYQSMLENEEWTRHSEIHVGVLPDGTHRMVNGYHRLHALARIPEDSGIRMPVRFIYESVRDEEELADFYGVIDNLGSRSFPDHIKAHGYAEKWGVSFDSLRSASSASALIAGGFTGGRSNSMTSARGRSVQYRMNFLEEWRPEITEASAVISQIKAKPLRTAMLRQSVMAVMLMTLRYYKDRAVQFWTSVATGLGLTEGDPALALRNWLLNTPAAAAHEHIQARYIANAWNSFYRNAKLTRPQTRSEAFLDPIVIDGTPYSRTHRERARRERLAAERERKTRLRKGNGNGKGEEVSEVQTEPVLDDTVPVLLNETYGLEEPPVVPRRK